MKYLPYIAFLVAGCASSYTPDYVMQEKVERLEKQCKQYEIRIDELEEKCSKLKQISIEEIIECVRKNRVQIDTLKEEDKLNKLNDENLRKNIERLAGHR